MAEKPCKPESIREEVKEHRELMRKPSFRKAVAGKGRKAMGKR
jgi:hypothetical protein